MTKFVALSRCYLGDHGGMLEADQEITVGPQSAHILMKNKNLKLVGKLEPLAKGKTKDSDEDEEKENIKVGPAPEGMRLVRQG